MRLAVAASIFPLARSFAAFMAMPAIDFEVIILSSLICTHPYPRCHRS
jgi:hypothetical protein